MVSIPNSKLVSCALLSLAMTGQTSLTANSSYSIQVAGLYCDHAVNPLAVDHRKPTLSWILSSARRGNHQSALSHSGQPESDFAPTRHRRFVGQRQSGL